MMEFPGWDDAGTAWQADAQCFTRGVDPNVMQPERATHAEVEAALQVCAGCPVLDECRTHAEAQDGGSVESLVGAYGVHAGAWWGPDPVWEVVAECAQCGGGFRALEREGSRAARFCGATCRQRARRAGLVVA